MHYIPCTDEQEKELLGEIGISNFNDLVKIIPENLRLKDDIGVGDALSEFECENAAKSLISNNKIASENLCFLGGGVYDHFVPKAVDAIAARSEFYTAYTPYQAEVSQGTLQYLYEFQTMICELSGMDVANASLYDGASAVAEACSVALSSTRNSKIAISKTVNPKYSAVVETYLQNRGVEIIYINEENGKTQYSEILNHLNGLAAVVIQSPNYYGIVEDLTVSKTQLNETKALLIAVSDPVSLSIIKSPGECGADIYAGEGQSLGNYMSYGGPFIGLLAVKSKLVRRMPGRIIGKTVDREGKEGFVLTLQTREQHIRRENATSNICTNQGLIALRATIHMSLMGKAGLPALAKICYDKAQYCANEISKINNISLPFGNEFIKEFSISVSTSAKELKQKAAQQSIFINTLDNDDSDSLIQICVTEKRTIEEIDTLIEFLKSA
ncbi:MAG: aminomethyl-transferring glycine dehydrogenase subunit GcvPA [Candidatus Marinimicrobia bacterium]|nr:aminomethyl-transferring glycine dehydrogenase subunit GcvPA [Candidatus Neomarinimicrobiota bacterium]